MEQVKNKDLMQNKDLEVLLTKLIIKINKAQIHREATFAPWNIYNEEGKK